MAKYKVYEISISGVLSDSYYNTLEEAEESFNKSLVGFKECVYKNYNNIYADVWQSYMREYMGSEDTIFAKLSMIEDGKEKILKEEGIQFIYVKREGKDINNEKAKEELRDVKYFNDEIEIL